MKHEEVESRVKTIIEEILMDDFFARNKIVLKKVKFSGLPNNYKLQVFIDKPGGVTIDDCYKLNKELSVKLDVEDFIDTHYILEVSSPGIDKNISMEELLKEAKKKQLGGSNG